MWKYTDLGLFRLYSFKYVLYLDLIIILCMTHNVLGIAYYALTITHYVIILKINNWDSLTQKLYASIITECNIYK